MIYDITGGIENGICYTKFIEKVEDEDSQGESILPKEGAQKSLVTIEQIEKEENNG